MESEENDPTPAKRARVETSDFDVGDFGVADTTNIGNPPGRLWDRNNGDQSMLGQNRDWEQWLNQKTPTLGRCVQMSGSFWRELIAHGVLDNLTMERLHLNATNADQVHGLCDLLQRSAVWKWHAFIRCLLLTSQEDVITTLGINPGHYKDPADEVPVIAVVAAFQSPPPVQTQQSVGVSQTTHHCRFTLQGDFDAGNADMQSPEYNLFVSNIEKEMEVTLKDITGKTTEVYVTYVSQVKHMVFVDINGIPEEDIRRALTSPSNALTMNNHKILTDTLIFKDDIPNAVSLEVVKNKHIHGRVDRQIDLDNQYVELKMITEEQLGKIQRVQELEIPDRYQAELQDYQGKVIRDEEIIKEGQVEKHVLIRGRAGIGKTTTMQRLMWRWAHGEWARHFKAFFLLNVRILMAITANVSLPVLLGRYSVYSITRGTAAMTVPGHWLEENQKEIGFVVDGLDEIYNFDELWNALNIPTSVLTEVQPLTWAFALMKRSCLSHSTLLIASRPFTALSYLKPKMSVEVMGLTRDKVLEFVEKNVPHDRITNVKRNLTNQPILLSVSAITFYCAALCQVLQEDIGVAVKLTTYTQITAYIMEMFMRRTTDEMTDFSSMCKLAYDGLVKRTKRGIAKLVFDNRDFKRQNLTQKDVDKARQAGIFLQTEIPEQSSPGINKVLGEFVHLSIQEFMAMTGLLMQRPADVKNALKTLSTSGQYNMGLLFLYGFAFNTRSEAIQRLSQVIGGRFEVDPAICKILEDTILDIKDQLQLLQMVHESQSAKMARMVGKKKFPEKVKFNLTKLTVVDVLAVIFLLKNHPSAVSIDLTGVGLDSFCLTELGNFLLTNRTVKHLKLRDAGIEDENVKYITDALEENETLTQLELDETRGKGDRVVRLLAKSMSTNPTLTELRLNFASVDEGSMKELSDALKKSSLTDLVLNGGCVTDDSVKHLVEAIKDHQTIAKLEIGSGSLTEQGVAVLAGILETQSAITELQLSYSPGDGTGIEHISHALSANKTLTTLGVSRDCVDDMGVKHLADALRVNQSLKKLELSTNKTTDEGLAYLAEALQANDTLAELVITSDEINDKGVRSLATLLQTKPTLTHLNMELTTVKEEGAESLLQALDANKTASLRVLDASCADDELTKRFEEHCRIKTGYPEG